MRTLVYRRWDSNPLNTMEVAWKATDSTKIVLSGIIKNYNIPFFLLSMSRAGRAVTFEMESYQIRRTEAAALRECARQML